MRDSEARDEFEESAEQKSEFLWYFTKERLRIYAFIYSLLQNSADAEDLFQQTSVTLWKKFSDFDQERDFYKWACGVALYDVKNFRRLSVHRRMVFNDELIEQLAAEQIDASKESRYQLELLDECVARLGETDQQIVARVYRDNWAVKKVASTLNRATQTIYNRLNLIRCSLLDCIERKVTARTQV